MNHPKSMFQLSGVHYRPGFLNQVPTLAGVAGVEGMSI